MKKSDAVVIGGGLLGCFALRNLRRYNISALLIEAEADVCTGISRANTAIVYSGCDNKPGSLKARICVRANERFDQLCSELDVPFSRCGSLMTACGEKAEAVLLKKLSQGRENGVKGLEIISGDEAREMEPMLSNAVTMALYAPATGVVNPWKLCYAAYENALENGARALMNTAVTGIESSDTGYVVHTDKGGDIAARMIINCAGLEAARVQQLIFPCPVQLEVDSADFLVYDKDMEKPSRIIFQETEKGKGISLVPTTNGNLIMDTPPLPLTYPYATSQEGLELLHREGKRLLPGLGEDMLIRSFAAIRPKPCMGDGRSINDFCIENPAPGFYSLIGIKTPGLSCADELGRHMAELSAAHLKALPNPGFDPRRQGIHCEDGEIVCLCEGVSRAEIIEAARRGAVTADGVKRRVGAGLGRCQGSRCAYEIERILEEYHNGAL